MIGWCRQVVPFTCLPPQCWEDRVGIGMQREDRCAGGQSGRCAEQTVWHSQDRVWPWKRLSDTETKPSRTVTNHGNIEQCRADIGEESGMKPSRMVTNCGNTEQFWADIRAEQ